MKVKNNNKNILKKVFIVFGCAVLFFAVSFSYLNFNLDSDIADADQKDYTVPYKNLPENKGVAFVFGDSNAVLVYLDFENSGIGILDIKYSESHSEYNGYKVDYTVWSDYELIAGIVDRIGGVNITTGEETLRYTGIQIAQLMSADETGDIKKQLIAQIFEQIAKNNFSKDDFVYIIENSKTNLTIVDCIYWLDHINEISKNINFIN